jgi:prolipoprotein diacylglyceryltransferase
MIDALTVCCYGIFCYSVGLLIGFWLGRSKCSKADSNPSKSPKKDKSKDFRRE